jgi:hypothetical protein
MCAKESSVISVEYSQLVSFLNTVLNYAGFLGQTIAPSTNAMRSL